MGIAVPPDRVITIEEWKRLPEGPPYYELIEGRLEVNPSPTANHQRVALNLAIVLKQACPPEFEVFIAPFDWIIDDHTVVEPDLLVVRRGDVGTGWLETVPLLVVEVTVPRRRSRDTIRKLRIYEAAGAPSYWLIDPESPQLTALELVGGHYETVAEGAEDDELRLDRPFPVTVVPSQLLA